MKKEAYLILTILLVLIILPWGVSAEEKYSEDYFVLKSEKYPASDDASSSFFKDGIDLEVDGARVSSRIMEDFNFGPPSNCSGTMSFNLKGDRDVKTGKMNGTFIALMKGTCPGTKDTPASPISLNWEGTFDGFATFSLDPADASKRIIEGKITNLKGEAVFKMNDVPVPTSPESVSINFPKVVLEGYERGVTRQDSGMRFSGMTGQVEWRADDDPDGWKLCKMGDTLPVYAHIRTQEDSSAILSFLDQSTFVLKADSEVVITTPPEKESKIKLVAGNIWVNVKKMINEGSMSIEMNQAVCGIKGTTFVASDDGKTSTLQVIEGNVVFTSKSDSKELNIASGSMISATSAGLGKVESFDIVATTADWDNISAISEKLQEKSDSASENKLTKFWYLYGFGGILIILIAVIVILKMKKA